MCHLTLSLHNLKTGNPPFLAAQEQEKGLNFWFWGDYFGQFWKVFWGGDYFGQSSVWQCDSLYLLWVWGFAPQAVLFGTICHQLELLPRIQRKAWKSTNGDWHKNFTTLDICHLNSAASVFILFDMFVFLASTNSWLGISQCWKFVGSTYFVVLQISLVI